VDEGQFRPDPDHPAFSPSPTSQCTNSQRTQFPSAIPHRLPSLLVALASVALLAPGVPVRAAETPDPIPQGDTRELVLHRGLRQLLVLERGEEVRRFPVAVGRPGWETPVGRFAVIELVADPIWEHPATGQQVPPGPSNPLGSRWIGFHRDCLGRAGFSGLEHLVVHGCVSSGFHGTPNRDSVGQAVSHGCVRLLDEHVRELFRLVRLGTPVTVLP
jgi:L,D-transpeptidase ErfK/SrfK